MAIATETIQSLTPHPDYVLWTLEKYLDEHNLSLNAFAVSHQLNYKTLHNFVNKTTSPRYETIEEIAQILIRLGCSELKEDLMMLIAGVDRRERVGFLARAARATLRPDQQTALAMQILQGVATAK